MAGQEKGGYPEDLEWGAGVLWLIEGIMAAPGAWSRQKAIEARLNILNELYIMQIIKPIPNQKSAIKAQSSPP